MPAVAIAQESGVQERSAARGALEEVLVTASKREESVMEVLGSVSAVSSETLDRNNIQDYAKLAELVPGFVVLDEERVSIRGISRTREGPSPVAFHVNDVFISQQGAPFYDMASVEVLRGPSGTVFGRNATAGAINAKWKRPEEEFGAGFTARYSSRTEKQFKFYGNAPMRGEGNDGWLLRVAGMVRQADGTLDNLLADDDSDPGNINDGFLRFYSTSQLTDDLKFSLRGIYYESNPKGASSVRTPSLNTRQSGDLEAAGAEPLPNDITKVRSRVDEKYGENVDRRRRVDGDITWSLHEVPLLGNFDTILVGGYQWRDAVFVFDSDGTEVGIFEAGSPLEDDIRSSAELRFVSANDTGIDWIFGLFWSRQTQTSDLDADLTVVQRLSQAPATLAQFGFVPSIGTVPQIPGEPAFPLDIKVTIRDQYTTDKSMAAYLNYNFNLAQLFNWADIELTAGIRTNRDEFFQETALLQSETSNNGIPAGPPLTEENSVEGDEFTATTGELGLRWFYSDEGMLYSKVSRGYKPGLAQTFIDENGNIVNNPVDPEILNALEIGWKNTLFDRTVRYELAAYYYDYQDLQVSQLSGSGLITDNAASATIYGLELGLQWVPIANMNIDFSAAAMSSTYNEYCGRDPLVPDRGVDAGCEEENPHDFEGATTSAAPELSYSLIASYRWDLDGWGSLTPSLRHSWTDVIDRRGLDNPFDEAEAYSLTDVRLTWVSPDTRWTVEAFLENIEDHDDIFFTSFGPVLLIGGSPNTFTLGNGLPPRQAGMVVSYDF